MASIRTKVGQLLNIYTYGAVVDALRLAAKREPNEKGLPMAKELEKLMPEAEKLDAAIGDGTIEEGDDDDDDDDDDEDEEDGPEED